MLTPPGGFAANWFRIACRFWCINWRGGNEGDLTALQTPVGTVAHTAPFAKSACKKIKAEAGYMYSLERASRRMGRIRAEQREVSFPPILMQKSKINKIQIKKSPAERLYSTFSFSVTLMSKAAQKRNTRNGHCTKGWYQKQVCTACITQLREGSEELLAESHVE